MLTPYLLTLYVILCLYTAWLGKRRVLGFWGVFVLSVLLTPALMALVLLISAPGPSEGS